MDDFKAFYQKIMKPAHDAIYPDKMRLDSDVSIDHHMNDIAKMVDFAKQWLR